MQDEIASGFVSVVRFVIYHVLWEILLFNLGRVALLVLTLGRYPRGAVAESHNGRVSLAGVAVIALIWLGVVLFNHSAGSAWGGP